MYKLIIINLFPEEVPIDYNTMPSITSWTDSNVSNNVLNLTTLSEISEVLTSNTSLADPKDLTKALLSGGNIICDVFKKNNNNFSSWFVYMQILNHYFKFTFMFSFNLIHALLIYLKLHFNLIFYAFLF